ncbi:MAG TPA: OmpA family protein [Candidatus Acidoferrales bacterium]|jgi:outer membrane protein OmpA-like peptidoglycan-associated protein|nr:OmpA family protein [Candidatus Acidoferrales bacterium]
MFKLSSITLMAVMALGVSARAQTESQVRVDPGNPAPEYRTNVVSRTTQAVSYKHRSGATKINFQGTDLMPGGAGEAKVESKRGALEIEVEFSGLGRPTSFGNEYLTYVLWAISPEGRPVNIGEVLVGENHRSKLDVTTDLQAFALIVTAEPYYAVRRPSNVVVLENSVRRDTAGGTEFVDAKYELIDRGGYIPTGYNFDPVVLSARLPLEFFEARNAVRIAKSAGADRYASESYEKAVRQMNDADALATTRHENKKALISISREVVQTAEDAREISVKHIDEERAEGERRAGRGRETAANNRADDESQRRANAEATTADAERDRNHAQQQQHLAEADSDRNRAAAASSDAQLQQAAGAQADAERDRNYAQQQQHVAEADSDRNRAAAVSSDAQLQQALRDREQLRANLLQQFNLILETRDTARGLVVNMSDVLFDSGKYTLRPLAREKLAKISGIVLAYPSLRLAVEGNTDSIGTELFNQELSEQRAEGVRSYLTQQGVPATSTTAHGFGKTRPIASNDTSEGRQQNRRVELIVSGEVIGTTIGSIVLQPIATATSPQ